MGNLIEVGPHRVQFESETGFIVMTQVGTIEAEHARGIMEAFGTLNPEAKRTASWVLANNTKATGITAEARKVFGSGGSESVPTFIAIYGSSFGFRAIANLVMTALKLTGHNLNGTSEATEADARAWLENKKREIKAS